MESLKDRLAKQVEQIAKAQKIKEAVANVKANNIGMSKIASAVRQLPRPNQPKQ
jgi:hypothetical protein